MYICCCVFFQSINPLIGKKMQDDRGRDYQNARRVAKDYESVTKGLNRNQPAIPPQNTPDEVKQVSGLAEHRLMIQRIATQLWATNNCVK